MRCFMSNIYTTTRITCLWGLELFYCENLDVESLAGIYWID